MRTAQQLIHEVISLRPMWPSDRKEWMNEAVSVMQKQQQELAALLSRIDTAPVAIMDTRDVLGLCAPTEEAFEALYALQGHKVALIDLGADK